MGTLSVEIPISIHRYAQRFAMTDRKIPEIVGGHLKCTTRGHFKMHHFLTV